MDLPAGAVDSNGNLLIVWADNTNSLRGAYTPLRSGQLTPVTLKAGGVQGSPSVICYHNSFYAFWRDAITSQLTYSIVVISDGTSSQIILGKPTALAGAFSSDGPQLALGNDFLYVGWRGLNTDEQLYFGILESSGAWGMAGPFSALNSAYAPALGIDPHGNLYLAYRGAATDPSLWSASGQAGIPGPPRGGGAPFNLSGGTQIQSANTAIITDYRPSLAMLPITETTIRSLLILFRSGLTISYVIGHYDNGEIDGWENRSFLAVSPLASPTPVLVPTASLSLTPLALLPTRAVGPASGFLLYQYRPSIVFT